MMIILALIRFVLSISSGVMFLLSHQVAVLAGVWHDDGETNALLEEPRHAWPRNMCFDVRTVHHATVERKGYIKHSSQRLENFVLSCPSV